MDAHAVIETHGAVLERLLESQKKLNRLIRLTAGDAGYIEPEHLCRDLVKTLPPPPSEFLAWARPERPRARIVWLLSALHAEDAGETEAAHRFAKHAASLESHDLLAQRLMSRTSERQGEESYLDSRFCRAPFEGIETSARGDVYFCCPAWLPVPIGNINKQSADEIWNSKAAQEIRQTIHDGSYRYCSVMHCPHLSGNKLPEKSAVTHKEHRRYIDECTTAVPRGPQRIVLAHDRSCNLSCPSCRRQLIVAKKAEVERLNTIADKVLLPLCKDARSLRVTASGDPFGSAHFRYILKAVDRTQFPKLWIDLQTNGLLLDRDAWIELGLEGLVRSILVSIDAAKPKTYAELRRGGVLERLLSNLDFIAELRARDAVERVRLDVVLQAANYRELPEIVAIAKSHGFDGVKCQMIRNWGTFTPEEFAGHDIGRPDHPEFDSLLDVLAQPDLNSSYVEYWGMAPVLRALGVRTAAQGPVHLSGNQEIQRELV